MIAHGSISVRSLPHKTRYSLWLLAFAVAVGLGIGLAYLTSSRIHVAAAHATNCTEYVGYVDCYSPEFAPISGGVSYSTPSNAVRWDNFIATEDSVDWILWYPSNGDVWTSGHGTSGSLFDGSVVQSHSDCASSFDDTYAHCETEW
jgi:hypothetical protein